MFLYIYLSSKLLLQVAIQPCHPSSRSHPKNLWPQNKSPHHVREIMNHKSPTPSPHHSTLLLSRRGVIWFWNTNTNYMGSLPCSFLFLGGLPLGSLYPICNGLSALFCSCSTESFFLGRRKDIRRRWNHSHHTLRFRKWEGKWWGTLGIGKSKFFERKFRQGYFISQWRFLFFVFFLFFFSLRFSFGEESKCLSYVLGGK